MGWNYDRPPIEYLERRIRYYKKQKPILKKAHLSEYLIDKYGKGKAKKLITQRLAKVENRIIEFEDAVNYLKQKTKTP